jgi:nucleoside phosphorylase
MDGADIAIVTVLPEEYAAVLAELGPHARDPGQVAPNTHGWQCAEVSGTGGRHRVVVALAGRPGNVSGALTVEKTVARWRPRHVLLVGIAGGFARDGLKLGDVVVSTVIWAYEYGKAAAVFEPRHDFTYPVDGGLLRSAMAYAAGTPNAAHFGPVASGEKVIDQVTPGLFGPVLAAWPKLLAVEMEGGGAAAAIEAARDAGHAVGFMMIRGISDMPGEAQAAGNAARRDAWKRAACASAAKFALGLIRNAWPVAGEPVVGEPVAEEDLGALLLRINSDDIRAWLHAHPRAGELGHVPGHRFSRDELVRWVVRAIEARPGFVRAADRELLQRLARGGR